MAGGQGELPLASGVGPFASRSSNASAIAGLYGWAVIRRGPEAKPEKLAPSELWKVELALDLAGWKPALLDGGDGWVPCKAGL